MSGNNMIGAEEDASRAKVRVYKEQRDEVIVQMEMHNIKPCSTNADDLPESRDHATI